MIFVHDHMTNISQKWQNMSHKILCIKYAYYYIYAGKGAHTKGFFLLFDYILL